jgi:8-oxo-dGTP pyrophosphatase MutT (NUDIX family)
VAALRELFEETGFLLADGPVEEAAARAVRSELLQGDISFAEGVDRLGASFVELRASYLARWVTPARFARRYDTRFFLAQLSGGHDAPPAPDLTAELADHLWLSPGEAVRRFTRGELPMLFPTRSTLQTLAGEPDIEALLQRCGQRVPEPVEPRLLVRGEVVRPVLPGDPDFEEAT